MQFSKVSEEKYLIRLELGEQINESLKKFCQKMEIENGSVSAIGSVKDPVLAHYRVDSKKYSEKTLKGIFEIASMTGNIGLFEGKPLIHIHVVVSDESMQAFAGHLVDAQVSATLEILLIKFNTKLTKSFNEQIGLKLYDLTDSC